MDLVEILSKKKKNTTSKLSKWLCWDHFLIFYYFVFPSFQSRPLTRYLPVRKDDFDLRAHIESAGHSTDTCFHLSISEKTCRGYLVKMGGKIKTWKKRWFVFDRNRRTLSYFAGEIEHRSKIWKIPTSSSSSCWDMDIFFTIPNQLCSPLFKKKTLKINKIVKLFCIFLPTCCRQTWGQAERSHLLPSHWRSVLWSLEECTQGKCLHDICCNCKLSLPLFLFI